MKNTIKMKIIYDSFIYKIIRTVENENIRKMYEIIRKHLFILDLNFILIFPMWISICGKKYVSENPVNFLFLN